MTHGPAQSTDSSRVAPRPLLAAWTLAVRELVRFVRQRNRVFGALGQPLIFWLLFSEGLGADYAHLFPGTLVMILLFTAIFATISVIEDRREGFLQSVLVAPQPRWAMVLGKVAGGSVLALLQGLLFLVLGYVTLDLHRDPAAILATVGFSVLIAVALTSLGFVLAWRMDSTQGFHAVMMVLLMPMWLLSGAIFTTPSPRVAWIERANPLSYGVGGLRHSLQLPGEASDPAIPLLWCWLVAAAFAVLMFAAACLVARAGSKKDYLV